MRATVCQLRNDADSFAEDWPGLVAHANEQRSQLVVLPEMPFHPWLCYTNEVDPTIWEQAVAAHDDFLVRLPELDAVVLGSRPVLLEGIPLNEGFIWSAAGGYRPVHYKYYLPDEPGFWEATWYRRSPSGDFTTAKTESLALGMMICTDMWFTQHARSYGQEGATILAVPRATPMTSRGRWVSGGATAAIVSGAFCLSSNRGGLDATGLEWAGAGWICDPDGDMLTVTSEAMPFATVDIDLSTAEAAKETYPRYVLD
jgi:N-carbamoylputrescine amidase